MKRDIAQLSEAINHYLKSSGKTLSTAESCTSGQIAMSITAEPGSSAYFKGGVVCYCNEIKTKILGVPSQILESKGAVSLEVVKAMVQGVIKTMDTTYAVAVTGYAGPGGGKEAPVGTIWIAVGSVNDCFVAKQEIDEGREKNLQRATKKALEMLLDLVKKHDTTIVK